MKRCSARVRFSPVACSVLLLPPVLTVCTLFSPAILAQQVSASPSPKELVRQATENELKSPFATQNCTYQYHREADGKQQTLIMVKSSDLVVGKLVRIGDVPLSRDQERQEDQRLWHLLHSTDEQERQRQRQQKFEHNSEELLGTLPEAFLFTETASENGPKGHHLIHFSFQPAPNFKPRAIEQQLLLGMAGTLIVDESNKQIVRLEANLFRDVDFGWGVLIHLNKGGSLLLDRAPGESLASGIRSFAVRTDGRLLVLKKFEMQWSFDHFSCIDHSLSLATAINMLTSPNVASVFPH